MEAVNSEEGLGDVPELLGALSHPGPGEAEQLLDIAGHGIRDPGLRGLLRRLEHGEGLGEGVVVHDKGDRVTLMCRKYRDLITPEADVGPPSVTEGREAGHNSPHPQWLRTRMSSLTDQT